MTNKISAAAAAFHRSKETADRSPVEDEAGIPIAAVERETGLAKDTLRVWEKRYGFPRPSRDGRGDRIYPASQVRRLQQIRRLLDAGMRPGKVVGLGVDELQDLLDRQAPHPTLFLSTTKVQEDEASALEPLLAAVAAHHPEALRHMLLHAQMRLGVAAFVVDLVAPLTHAVGMAWAQGRFEVFEEHLYSEVVAGVLRQIITTLAVPAQASSSDAPKVLLTTVPDEVHGLGLLMVEAMLTLEGCTCVSLGTQTPLGDIVHAAQAHRADVVALSFSSLQSGPSVVAGLRELRLRLPDETALWAGGACATLYQKPIAGITAVRQLSALAPLVSQWRNARRLRSG